MELFKNIKKSYNINNISEEWMTDKLNDFNVIYSKKELNDLQNVLDIINWNKSLLHSFLKGINKYENFLNCSEIICFLRVLINKNKIPRSIIKVSELYVNFLFIKRDVRKMFTNNIELIENKLSNLLIRTDCSYEKIKYLLNIVNNILDKGYHSNIEEFFSNTLIIIFEYNLCFYKCDEVFHILESTEPTFWESEVHELAIRTTFKGGQVRSLDKLFNFIGSHNELINKEEFQTKYINVLRMYNSTSEVVPFRQAQRKIANWSRYDIVVWSGNVRNGREVSESEMVAVVMRGVEVSHSFSPRPVQLLALISLLGPRGKQGRLVQVNTGEGKSIIVAMLAVIKALQGYKVDVITTSTELSLPEVQKQMSFFDMFRLTVGENSNPSTKQSVYKQDIVYGIASDFMADVLKTEYLGENVRVGRDFQVAIIDEVDSMLIDGRSSCVQLSSHMPAMNHLEVALAETLNAVSLKRKQFVTGLPEMEDKIFFITEDFNVKNNEIKILSGKDLEDCIIPVENNRKEFIKKYTKNHLQNLFRELSFHEEEELQLFKEIKQKISEIDKKINNLKNCSSNNDEREKYLKEKKELVLEQSKLPWTLRRSPVIEIPDHLHGFVLGHIDHWVDSALRALHYKREKHYDVKHNQIVPIDHSNTGVLQEQVKWNDGLAQFLQIKEGLKITPENLSTTFISNVEFFKRYSTNIFGLTGTLGSAESKTLLCDVYNTNTVIIPPHKINKIVGNIHSKYLCKELPTIIEDTEEKWCESILKSILSKVNNQRGALIICTYIEEVKLLQEVFKKNYDSDKLYTYTGQEKFEKKKIKEGEIIIATNIAGRGTDLKTSSTIEKNGGLHVCLTFLPGNLRVELQNVGRTSREGLKGTAQLIICQRQITSIHTLRARRDEIEAKRMKKARQDVDKITIRDRLFKKFSLLRKECFDYFNYHIFEIQDLEERWAIWLRCITDEIDNANDLEQLNQILEKFESFSTSTKSSIQKIYNPFFHVLKGNEFLKNEQYNNAIDEYNNAIKLNPKLGLNAYYNKACCAIIETKCETEGQLSARKDLQNAKALISNSCIPNLAYLFTIIQKVSSSKELLQQIQNQMNILREQETYIHEALVVLETTLKNGWKVKIDLIEIDKIFKNVDVCYKNEIEEAKLNGLNCFFKLTEDKPKSWWSCIALSVLSLLQIGAALYIVIMFPELAIFLLPSLISGGVSEAISAVHAGIRGTFDWGSWALVKSVDLLISAGLGAYSIISTPAKSLFFTAKEFAFRAVFKESSKEAVINVTKQIAVELPRQLLNEVNEIGEKIATPIVDDKLSPIVTRTISQVMDRNKIIQGALKLDEMNKNTYWQNKIVQISLEVFSENCGNSVDKFLSKYSLEKGINQIEIKLKAYENVIGEQLNVSLGKVNVHNRKIRELINPKTEVDDDEIPVIDIRYQNTCHSKEETISFAIDSEVLKLKLSRSITENLTRNYIKPISNILPTIWKMLSFFKVSKTPRNN